MLLVKRQPAQPAPSYGLGAAKPRGSDFAAEVAAPKRSDKVASKQIEKANDGGVSHYRELEFQLSKRIVRCHRIWF